MSDVELFRCRCSSNEHILLVEYLPEETDLAQSDLCISVHLTEHSLWRRIKYATAYVLGRGPKFGAFDEVLLDRDRALELKLAIDKFLSATNS